MSCKLFCVTIFSVIILITLVNTSVAQTVTRYDGEYATKETIFEYELLNSDDPGGWLNFYWGFNTSGNTIRFEIGKSVFSEDYIDVYYDGIYKIPMEIYFGNTELDVNLNSTIYNYWEDVFWQKLLLPIEDGQYNIFDVLEEQDPESYDVKGDEVSFFTSESEVVYDYNTGIALNWTSTVTYDFILSYILPESSSDKDEGFRDKIPLSLFPIFVALVVLKFKNKLSSNIFKNK